MRNQKELKVIVKEDNPLNLDGLLWILYGKTTKSFDFADFCFELMESAREEGLGY